eukprot:1175928-Prorocentrum_minimum.AAC.2
MNHLGTSKLHQGHLLCVAAAIVAGHPLLGPNNPLLGPTNNDPTEEASGSQPPHQPARSPQTPLHSTTPLPDYNSSAPTSTRRVLGAGDVDGAVLLSASANSTRSTCTNNNLGLVTGSNNSAGNSNSNSNGSSIGSAAAPPAAVKKRQLPS